VILTTGGLVSRVTFTESEPMFPAASVAVRMMVFSPSIRCSESCVVCVVPSMFHETAIGVLFT
jgi:hypothetical protein